ncbi:dihydroneopterin aldolase [Rhodocytophaga rosea]|uniref:7,8-dihydroneopterin aldolase n=1 Tax=Rhodocytophaga rosea TaxID=2704465 RepID=A0A6C0GQ83_9BACT|nr:dihydroneopterin aldolase [Rhodocytophaga rosea]QHT70087.1 dihydroneopterin aldolase [Rhodocytophaga rosea]
MAIISLEGAEFFAYHGFYEEERKIGNKYRIDLSVSADVSMAAADDDLNQTVNYGDLYAIISQEMQTPSQLLEHIAHRIIEETYKKYPHIEWAEVSVSKYNPPIGGICHRAVITIRK